MSALPLSLSAPANYCTLVLTLDDVREVADLLVAHGRRTDAVALVTDTLDMLEDPRAQLLLARLHLESRTRAGAEEAATILHFWTGCRPDDLEALTLLRGALLELGRRRDLAQLDRKVSWTSTPSPRRTPGRPQT